MSNTTSPAYYCVKHNITLSTVAYNEHLFNFSLIDILPSYHASLYVALYFSDVNMFCLNNIRRDLDKLVQIYIPEVHKFVRYSETCLNRTVNKPKSCINRTLNKVLMQEIFVNLTCINRTPVLSEHKSWSHGGSVQTGLTVFTICH